MCVCTCTSGFLCQKPSTHLLPGTSSDSEVECDTEYTNENMEETVVFEDREVLPLPCSGSYPITYTCLIPFLECFEQFCKNNCITFVCVLYVLGEQLIPDDMSFVTEETTER